MTMMAKANPAGPSRARYPSIIPSYHVRHFAGVAAEIVGEGEEAPGEEQGEDPGVLLGDVGQQGQLKGGASGAGHGKQGANEQIDAHG